MLEKIFRKYIPIESFDRNAFIFQHFLQNYNNKIGNNFFTNNLMYIYPSKISSYENLNIIIETEYIDTCQYDIGSKEFAKIAAQYMAKIHNLTFNKNSDIKGKIKTDTYDSLNVWNSVLDSPGAKDAYYIRKNIFTESKEILADHPRIMLHRDFRPHNIICDKNSQYYLIDFEFAAKDFVGIEVMGFLGDLIKSNTWDYFLYSYIRETNFNKSIILNMPDTYIKYLCTNTFPYYAINDIDKERYNHIKNERDERLLTFFNKLPQIKEELKQI